MPQNEIRTGRLQETELPDLLQELYSSQASGTLTLLHQDKKKSVFLKNGKIVSAASTLPDDLLGNILVKEGKLSRDQVDLILGAENGTGKKFGALVVEMGFLDPKGLFDALKSQVREIIFSLFKWEEGSFRFEPGELPKDLIPLSIDPAELISDIIEKLQQESSQS